VSWSGPAQTWLVGRDGTRSPWPFADDAQAVAKDPALVGSLVARLRQLGADLDAAVAVPDAPVTLQSSAEAGLAVVHLRPKPAGTGRRQSFDVVLYDDGLLIHPAPASATGVAAGIRAQLPHTDGRKHAHPVDPVRRSDPQPQGGRHLA
jgi:hypothetical protein